MSEIKNRIHKLKRTVSKTYSKRFTFAGGQASLAPRLFPKKYLEYLYRKQFGKELDLEHPKTFSEKLQWIKLYDRNPEYTDMVDKYAAREIVKKIWGEEYLIPLLGVWDSAEEIDFSSLPDEFIMKCNHNSGGILFCKDKNKLDLEDERRNFAEMLKVNYYYYSCEWPYKNIKRKVVAEKWMKNSDGTLPVDYKLFCFNGKVKVFLINSNRIGKEQVCSDFLDMDWNRLDIWDPGCPHTDTEWKKPAFFDDIVKKAEEVTRDIPFCRVDFLVFDDKVYFGEFTFFHEGGSMPLCSEKWEKIWGDYLRLPMEKGE